MLLLPPAVRSDAVLWIATRATTGAGVARAYIRTVGATVTIGQHRVTLRAPWSGLEVASGEWVLYGTHPAGGAVELGRCMVR
jgi:hypothetical protein